MRSLVFHTMLVMAIGMTITLCAVPAKAENFQRTTFYVENLVCSSCLALIETDFKKNPGVVGMTADLRSKTVTADHIARVSGQQLAETVSRLGYSAIIVKQEAVDESKINKFSNSFARCGVGGCRTAGAGGCNATAAAGKELYHRYIK